MSICRFEVNVISDCPVCATTVSIDGSRGEEILDGARNEDNNGDECIRFECPECGETYNAYF